MPCENYQDRCAQGISHKKHLVPIMNDSCQNSTQIIVPDEITDLHDSTQITKIIEIYVHNVSGAKTKTDELNSFLATTIHDFVLLQETWFDATIDSDELIASTEFSIFRADRSQFKSKKTTGVESQFLHVMSTL